MERKINIAELLKDCPKGMELDCVNCDGIVRFEEVSDSNIYPIKVSITYNNECFIHLFTKYGQTTKTPYNKCVIFPKGKTTWEGFQRPFKNGDIVFYNDTIAIFKEWGDETLFRTYVTKYLCNDSIIDTNVPLFGKSVRKEIRFATEKEKQKLFDAIKANGYHWNAETKTLEKLIKLKFKKGDKVRVKRGFSEPRIIDDIRDTFYTLVPIGKIDFTDQNNWELVIEPKFKVGDNQVKYTICNLYCRTLKCTVTSKDLQPYKEETMEEIHIDKIGFNGDKVKLILSDGYEIQTEGKEVYVVKKQPRYPKTYEECCESLGIDVSRTIGHSEDLPFYRDVTCYEYNLLSSLAVLRKLLICRDAYWKIAGVQMGLGKLWEPDWTNHEFKHCIKVMGNTLECISEMNIQCILAFPTPKMRDAFFENFKEEIENCKELL